MPYQLQHLFQDVPEANETAWNAASEFIATTMAKGKGVRIRGFGRFSMQKRDLTKKVFRLDARFKNGIRTKEYPIPPEVSLTEMNYVWVASRAGCSKDAAKAAIEKCFARIGLLVRSNETISCEMPGVGVLWSKNMLLDFRFNVEGDDIAEDPDAARNRQKLGGMSSTQAQLQKASGMSSSFELGASKPAGMRRPGTLKSDAELKPADQRVPTPKARAVQYGFSPAVPETKSLPEPSPLDQLLAQRGRRPAKGFSAKKGESSGDMSMLPTFLVPEVRPAAQRRLEKATAVRDEAINLAYQRHHAILTRERQALSKQEAEIKARRSRSEAAHRAKVQDAQRKRLENRDYVLSQANEKKSKDKKSHDARRFLTDPDPALVMPQGSLVNVQDVHRVQKHLRKALDKQVRDKRRSERRAKEQDVREQRFFLDCVHKQLVEDRLKRRDRKNATQNMLQEEWHKQQMLRDMAKEVNRGY